MKLGRVFRRTSWERSDSVSQLESIRVVDGVIELTVRLRTVTTGKPPKMAFVWRVGAGRDKPRKIADLKAVSANRKGILVYRVPIRVIGATVQKEWISSFICQIKLWYPPREVSSIVGGYVLTESRSLPIDMPDDLTGFSANVGRRTINLIRSDDGHLRLRLDRRTGSLNENASGRRIMLLLNEIALGGGKTKAVFQLAEQLAAAGHDVRVTALWFSNREPKFCYPENIGFDFIDGAYRVQSSDPEAGTSEFSLINKKISKMTDQRMREYLKANRFDFIYVPNWDSPMYKIIEGSVHPQTVLVLGDHNPRRPEMVERGEPNPDFVWAANNFDAVHTVNPLIADLVQPLTSKEVFAIPNMVELKQPIDRGREFFKTRRLVSVGRLVGTKRMNHLIDAFVSIQDRFPEWTLDIFGEGEKRPDLEKQLEKLRTRRVRLRGFDPAVTSTLAEGAVFVSASAAEAHPLVLIEAMVAGCPIVSYDKQYGAKYMIANGKTGFLAADNDRRALADAMANVMTMVQDEDERLLKVIAAAAEATSEFSQDRIVRLWLAKVDALCRSKHRREAPSFEFLRNAIQRYISR